jgi:hypothetical protein
MAEGIHPNFSLAGFATLSFLYANSMTAMISGKLGLHTRSLLWNSAHLLRQHNCLAGTQHNLAYISSLL